MPREPVETRQRLLPPPADVNTAEDTLLEPRREEAVHHGQVRPACYTQLWEIFTRQHSFQRSQIAVQLLDFAGTQNQRSNTRLRKRPGQRHLCHVNTGFIGNRANTLQHLPVALGKQLEGGQIQVQAAAARIYLAFRVAGIFAR